MRMDAVARGSSMSGIAREPQETEKTGVSLAVLLRPDWVYSDWVRGLEGSTVSHTSSDTLTLCPLWTTELPQTPSAPPVLTSAPSSCCRQKNFHDCCSHFLIAPQNFIAFLGNSLERVWVFFLSIRTAILTKAQVISVKHFAQIFIFFKQSSKMIQYNILTFLRSAVRATMLWNVCRIHEYRQWLMSYLQLRCFRVVYTENPFIYSIPPRSMLLVHVNHLSHDFGNRSFHGPYFPCSSTPLKQFLRQICVATVLQWQLYLRY